MGIWRDFVSVARVAQRGLKTQVWQIKVHCIKMAIRSTEKCLQRHTEVRLRRSLHAWRDMYLHQHGVRPRNGMPSMQTFSDSDQEENDEESGTGALSQAALLMSWSGAQASTPAVQPPAAEAEPAPTMGGFACTTGMSDSNWISDFISSLWPFLRVSILVYICCSINHNVCRLDRIGGRSEELDGPAVIQEKVAC
jgi:hypothetical protein